MNYFSILAEITCYQLATVCNRGLIHVQQSRIRSFYNNLDSSWVMEGRHNTVLSGMYTLYSTSMAGSHNVGGTWHVQFSKVE